MVCRPQGEAALENTGLVDQFFVKPKAYYDNVWTDEEKSGWLIWQTRNVEFDHYCRCRPSLFMWHKGDNEKLDKVWAEKPEETPEWKQYKTPVEFKRARNKGKSYFDELARSLKVMAKGQECVRDGVPEAFGERPVTKITHQERSWLRDFRYIYNIPKDAFLLGWQFTASSEIKYYPYFPEVMQYHIMPKYPNLYVVGLGDLEKQIQWPEKCHGGRFVNLGRSVTFRQAYLLTSILDLLVSPETGIYVFAQAYSNVPKILLASHTDGTHITIGAESKILAAECDCAPCYSVLASCDTDEETGASKCMASIKPDRVIAAIEEVINAN